MQKLSSCMEWEGEGNEGNEGNEGRMKSCLHFCSFPREDNNSSSSNSNSNSNSNNNNKGPCPSFSIIHECKTSSSEVKKRPSVHMQSYQEFLTFFCLNLFCS